MKTLFACLFALCVALPSLAADNALDALSYSGARARLEATAKHFPSMSVSRGEEVDGGIRFQLTPTMTAVVMKGNSDSVAEAVFMVTPDPAASQNQRLMKFVEDMTACAEFSGYFLFPEFDNMPEFRDVLLKTVSPLNQDLVKKLGKKSSLHLTDVGTDYIAMLTPQGMYILSLQRIQKK